jgi:TolB-like protein/DNA-binding winged helix-turn-helix (wHTH) protein/Flp pilus assembly protein TadD
MIQPTPSFPTHEPFLIADWTVDPSTHRIHREGDEIKLEAKMMALLVALARRAAEVVTREEIEREVWNSRVVSYDALTVCIKKLRKTLGDDPRAPRYIETIAKKGYRLIAPVRPIAASDRRATSEVAPPKPSRARHALALAATLGAVALLGVLHFAAPTPARETSAVETQLPTLAVLPFENLNRDPEQDYLSDGLTADITTALSGNAELFVIANPSVLAYKDQAVDAPRVADALGVRYVLQGTVQRADAQLRVNAKLVDARSGVQLWAERYDRGMNDVFELQDDIVSRIVGALEVKLTEEEKRLMARRYTTSVAAYDAFLRGQTAYSYRTREGNRLARAAYEQAVEIDPNFARAYSALALTYTNDHRFGWDTAPGAALARAHDLARKAVEIDDQLPQAQWVLGHVQLHRREFDLAKHAARQAIRLNPNFADGYMALANAMVYSDEAAAALPLIRKAMRLNPRYPAQYAEILGQAYYFLDRHEEAVASLRDATERNANLLPSYVFLAAAQSGLGNTAEAKWTVDQLRTLMPGIRSGDVPGMFPIENPDRLAMIVERLKSIGL